MHQKHEPALKGKPFVLLAGKLTAAGSARAKIFMCSTEAHHKEVHEGMRLSEARGVCAELLWREYNSSLYLDAQRKLVHALVSCSPQVTAQETGIFLLDASGLKHLGGEGKFCRNVLKLSSQSGYTEGHVGIADSAFAAIVATRLKHTRWYIVPQGRDADFLAAFSIRHLPVSLDMQEALMGLGIKSMGQLTGLSITSLEKRFGAEGVLAYELALGRDDRRPCLPEPERRFECSVELGGPVDSLNEILFVLKAMLDRLTKQLQQEGLWVEELLLSLYNDNDKVYEHPVKLIHPSNHAKFLLEVVTLSLAERPIKREITGITLAVSRFSPESWEQTSLSGPAGQEAPGNRHNSRTWQRTGNTTLPESLTLLLQRLIARCGEDAVVRPVATDHYFREYAGVWIPILQDPPTRSSPAVDTEHLQTPHSGIADGLVLRRTPTIPLLLEFQNLSLAAINYGGQWHNIKACTIPERLSGLWWEKPVQHSYYTALISDRHAPDIDTRLVLLIRDHLTNRWYLGGNFD